MQDKNFVLELLRFRNVSEQLNLLTQKKGFVSPRNSQFHTCCRGKKRETSEKENVCKYQIIDYITKRKELFLTISNPADLTASGMTLSSQTSTEESFLSNQLPPNLTSLDKRYLTLCCPWGRREWDQVVMGFELNFFWLYHMACGILFPLTRDGNCTPCIGSAVFTTGTSGKSFEFNFIWILMTMFI